MFRNTVQILYVHHCVYTPVSRWYEVFEFVQMREKKNKTTRTTVICGHGAIFEIVRLGRDSVLYSLRVF